MFSAGGGYLVPSASGQISQIPIPGGTLNLPIRRKDLLQSPGRVNINALPSYAPMGNDVPSEFLLHFI